MASIEERAPRLFDDGEGPDGTDPQPPLELSFPVNPDRIPRLKKKLEEYAEREAELAVGYQHPELRVRTGGGVEMYKPFVLSAILDICSKDPDATITMGAIADTLSERVGFNVRPAAIPYVWSDNLSHYVPNIAGIVHQYELSDTKEVDMIAGVGFAGAYAIVSDYASGEQRFIVPGTGTGLPE